MDILNNSANARSAYKGYKPVLTIVCCLASLVLFIGFNIDGLSSQEAYKKWGAPSFIDIFSGSYWGLITSNFLHTEWWHILFNLYWFWLFGKKIEFHSNKLFYGFLLLSAALTSSVAQMIVSGASGIGLSGIGYALFGFLLVRSRYDNAYKGFLTNRTITFFLFWILLCLVLTKTGVLAVGNGAHVAGLLWGILLGFSSMYRRQVFIPVSIVLLASLTAFAFLGKYSIAKRCYDAYQYHKNQEVDKAMVAYQNILKLDPTNEFGKENLLQLKIYKLSLAENESEARMKYDDARKRCNEILQLDRDNEWARAALSRLPNP